MNGRIRFEVYLRSKLVKKEKTMADEKEKSIEKDMETQTPAPTVEELSEAGLKKVSGGAVNAYLYIDGIRHE